MDLILLDIPLILILSLTNGALSMSELALVSANRARLSSMASAGKPGAALALKLASNPAQMLATVQIGITCIGVLAGVLGGAAIAEDFADWLLRVGLGPKTSELLAFTFVVGSITYLTVVIGELIPKQLALAQPEWIATRVAWPLHVLSRICSPLVAALEVSSSTILRLLPIRTTRTRVTDEDISHFIQQGVQEGVIHQVEKDIAYRVFRLDDRPVRAFMTRRSDLVWLDVLLDPEENYARVRSSPHSYFPVGEGSLDNLRGVINAKELLACAQASDRRLDQSLIRPALTVQASTSALATLELFKRERGHLAVVLDQDSSVCGLITTHDLMEAIVGDLADYEGEAPAIVRRADGSALVEAYVDAQELLMSFGIEPAEDAIPKEYHSVGGVLFAKLGGIPTLGSQITWHGLCLEVVDMDRHRIDKVLVSKGRLADGY